jgi:hypothetical protein
MKTTQELLLEIIADVNHADALSSIVKDALPPETPEQIKRDVADLYECIGRLWPNLGELQHSLALLSADGSLTMPPADLIAKS